MPQPTDAGQPVSIHLSAFRRFDGYYVTMARKSCNDGHVGVIQQPDYCVRGRHPKYDEPQARTSCDAYRIGRCGVDISLRT